MAGLKTLISLSFVLAFGFILIILSSVLYHTPYPILVVATYLLAPLPNIICGYCASPDDFIDSSSGSPGAVVDFGRFMTGFLFVMGIALPALLAHCAMLPYAAAIMSIAGGLLIYGTIISFKMVFREEEDF